MTKAGKMAIAGLEEAVAFFNGEDVPGAQVHIPAEIDAASIRKASGLSQARFADRIGVSIGTLKQWEQGRRVPTGPARVLLTMLAKNPRVVEETIGNHDSKVRKVKVPSNRPTKGRIIKATVTLSKQRKTA